ncbi:glycoside hydrolase [Truncatella angustata]|uniref:Mannan endo-1,6-alpha-mannosidase n=1 Tax=Truncatella angustata TaxID=152316 RepID=A0A9P8UD85_9PEZI|nr:glycoside hydrolase [Truncatella angustata]KAH6647332.1 glycoside hydrolase [Truncatella angustata]
MQAAAALVAEDLLSFYDGDKPGGVPGIFGSAPPAGDYYWWTGSLLWSTLLDYRSRTGNTTYDDTILEGLQWQVGSDNDFMPANWTASEGNDDQSFWAQAALLADETGFVDPPSGDAQWLALAQTVFDVQSVEGRHVSEGNCSGALRWQIYTFNNGYSYVNTASNAGFFSIGAQLAVLTKNDTYGDEAAKTYDILSKIGLVSDDFNVYDGLQADACNAINRVQFSYAAGVLLQGSAYMYNYTNDDIWKTRVDGLVDRTLELFFPKGIATEIACEDSESCTSDMLFYKGILHRSLAYTMKLAPHTTETILPVLKTSAAAAVLTCTGGDNKRMCGFTWADGKFDNSSAAAQTSVLSALVSVLQSYVEVNTTGSGGGNSGNSTSTTGSSGGSDGASGSGNSTGSGGSSIGTNIGVSFSVLVGGLLVAGFLG